MWKFIVEINGTPRLVTSSAEEFSARVREIMRTSRRYSDGGWRHVGDGSTPHRLVGWSNANI